MSSRLPRTLALAATGLLLAAVVVHADVSPTRASTTYGVDYAISAPMTQGSYVTNGALIETFDSAAEEVACASVAIGTITGDCRTDPPRDYGGASTSTAVPTSGGTGTVFATTTHPDLEFTLDLTTPARYLGLWWSAGSGGNELTFYDGEDELLSLSTNDLITLLGDSPVAAQPYGSTGTIAATDGTEYTRHHFFGNPRGYPSTSPVAPSTMLAHEPFVYLHIFSVGGLTFDRVVFTGGGFEFDNLVVSALDQVPASDLVRVGSVDSQIPPPPTAPPTTTPTTVTPPSTPPPAPSDRMMPRFAG